MFTGLKTKTVSLWSYVNNQIDMYRNPLYWAPSNQQQVLVPIASIRHIKLWKAYYCRWNPSMRIQVNLMFDPNHICSDIYFIII